MNKINAEKKLTTLVELLDIPASYYDKAAARHRALGDWLCRQQSKIAAYKPVIYPQGSFRLGTVIRPLLKADEYDLDVVCELALLTKSKITQKRLKELVGEELKAYAAANSITEPIRERKRCWRLRYSDEVKFHIDILPCIPEDAQTIAAIAALGVNPKLARMSIALTCNKSANYEIVDNGWPMSNPGGYGEWFEQRMAGLFTLRRKGLVEAGAYNRIEDVPTWALKTPLQRSIQLLKRHRDVMFKDDCEGKPISMIITTLAARAYNGEEDIEDSVAGILDRMPQFVVAATPRVANPVNPGEDFADKWARDGRLAQNFVLWHRQAARDFAALAGVDDRGRLQKDVRAVFSIDLSDQEAKAMVPNSAPRPNVVPAIIVPRSAPSPWKDNG